MSRLVESLTKNNRGKLEGVFQKSVRHILSGEFDKKTLKQGFKLWKESLQKGSDYDCLPTLSAEIENFAGNQGHTVYRYKLHDEYPNDPPEIAIVEFSSGSAVRALHLEIVEEDENPCNLLYAHPSASAYFIGPTRAKPSPDEPSYPNNGYFTKSTGVLFPFMDTKPPGQRRGALAQLENREFLILEEQARINARDSDFAGYDLVSGTSYYFTSVDSKEFVASDGGEQQSHLSYLACYIDVSGATRYAHIEVDVSASRVFIKRLLDSHAQKYKWQSYIAAELEYMGAGCAFKDKKNPGKIVLTSLDEEKAFYFDRNDRYLIVND